MASALVVTRAKLRYPDILVYKSLPTPGYEGMLNVKAINPYLKAFEFIPNSSQPAGYYLKINGLGAMSFHHSKGDRKER